MGKPLSRHEIKMIVETIDGWPAGVELTWEALLKRIERRMKIKPARQTLARHLDIKLAYQSRKAALRKSKGQRVGNSMLNQQLARAEAEIERLKLENERHRERFVRWQYNAYKRGIENHELDAPLPSTDRRRSA